MLELYLAIGLIGMGYLANKNGKQNRTTNTKFKKNNLNQRNIYENNISKKVNQIDKERANNLFNEAKEINKTINPYQHNVLFKTNSKPQPYLNKNINNYDNNIESNFSASLNNSKIDNNETNKNSEVKEHFHNNMVPFFGGSVKQPNLSNNVLVSNYTGRDDLQFHKKEQSPLFSNKNAMSFVNGTPNYSNDSLSRYNLSSKRKNNIPFEQIKVGPGLGLGYNEEAKGNFHQFEINELVKPKNIDELRTLNNPKNTYKGRIISGKKIDKRSNMGTQRKYRPDKYYHNNPDRYFKTTGAVLKQNLRENFEAKDTEKQIQREYIGAGAPASHTKPNKVPLHQKSRKNIYKTTSPRNAQAQDQWKEGVENSDYGKNSINIKPNERDVTQKRTHLSNLITNVKALITPLQDAMKTTKKENTIGNNRPEGNVSMPIPEKMTVKDPNDIARTTIKETLIDNERDGNMSGHIKQTVHDPNDIARTTIKETTIENEYEGNLTGNVRTTVYDPNDVAKTTIKETTIENDHDGNMSGPKRLTVYDPNDIARTTIKETLIHNDRTGTFHGETKNMLYQQDKAKTTTKETLPNVDYNKHINANLKHRVYEDNAKTTMKETTIDNKRNTGNAQFDKGAGYIIDPAEAPNTNRQFTSNEEYIGNPDGDVGIGGGEGYLTSNFEAPNTNKQFLSDEEYMGHAGSVDEKQRNYSDMYNARLNINKEKISKGRAPTQTGTKVAAGEENVNILHKKQMSGIHLRNNQQTNITNRIRTKEDYNLVNLKKPLSNELNIDRINKDYVEQFNKNPYTQSLSSYGINEDTTDNDSDF